MTTTDSLRDAFADLTPTECAGVAQAFLNARDQHAGGDRIGRALAQAYTLIAGACVDAQKREDEVLHGIMRATPGHRVRGSRE